jgi:hypothetical protein
MKVLSDILHKAGILKEGAEAYSSGGYSVVVRNATTQRFETVASTAFANIYTSNGTLTGNRTVTLSGSYLDIAGTTTTRFFSTGNVTVGGTVDAGFKLDVNGEIRGVSRVSASLGGLTNNCLYTYISNHCGSAGYIGFGFVNTTNPALADSVFDIYQGPVAAPIANLFNIKHSLLNASYVQPQAILGITTTINQSATATGDIRGIYYNPTVTSVIGNHYAWESTSGKIKVSDLSGTGSRMVVADSSGVLSTSALPTSTNIYNSDGTLTGNRTVALGGYKLSVGVPTTSFASGSFELGINAASAFSQVIHNTNGGGAGAIVFGANNRYMHIGMAGTSLAWPVNGAAFIHNTYADLYFTGGSSGQPGTGDVIMTMFRSTKNVTVGGITDSGYKLDVQGTARVTGAVRVDTNGFNRTGSAGSGSISIGNVSGLSTATADGSISIGSTSSATGLDSTALGTEATASSQSSIAIGRGAISNGVGGIAIGVGARASGTELVIGNRWQPINEVFFGTGSNRWSGNTQFAGDGASCAINGSGAFGTDFAGGNITIAGGKGTGAGTPGDVIISTATATASGTTLQSLTQRVWIKGENGNVGIGASPNASYKLDVAGTGRFTNMLSVITTGTTNEVALFKSTEPYITVEAAGGSNSASIFLKPSTSSQNATIQNRTGGGLEFYVNADYTNAKMTIKGTTVNIRSLPTSATGLSSGDIWNDGGTLKVA